MVKRDEITKYIFELIDDPILDQAMYKDEMANCIQVTGGDDVEVVTLGVSLNEEFLQKAVSLRSNFCLFHHGLDTQTYKGWLPGYYQKRLRLIFKHDVTIMGFHFALDAHPEYGNNAQIIKKLGATLGKPLFEEWGYTATFEDRVSVKSLVEKCRTVFGHDIISFINGPDTVKTIGVVSGAGKPYAMHLAELETKGVELYISGETSESVPHKLKESGINYFVCGHYATETFGVKAIGEKLREKFGERLNVQFIDVPNPI